MANTNTKKALLGGLLSIGGSAAFKTLDRKTRGMSRKKGSGLGDCGQCTAVKRAAKMINNKRWNMG